MDRDDLEDLIDKREQSNVEFKKRANKLADELCALANSEDGGKILIGVNDANEIDKIPEKDINGQRSKVEEESRRCQPEIDHSIEIVDNVLVVDVPPSNRLHKAPNGWYIKDGSSKKKLGRDEVVAQLEDRGEISFDQAINEEFKYPEDFDEELFEAFVSQKVSDPEIRDSPSTEDKLMNLGLAMEEEGEIKPNNAAILMFCKNPRKYFSQAEIICGNFASEERATVLSREKIRSPVPKAVSKAVEFVVDNIDTTVEYEGGIEREERPIFPKKAIREAVANAIMHRDYLRQGESINIDIFPEKVIFESPGGLPQGIKENDLGKRSLRRNPKLAEIMDDAGLAERMGTGIQKMKLAMEERSLPEPDFDAGERRFRVTFYSQQLPFDVPEDISDRQKDALIYTYKEDSITNSEYRKLFDVSRGTAYNDLSDLEDRGLIRRQGKGRNTKYELRTN